MRCNDCINYKTCKLFGENIFGNHYEYKVEEICHYFKDKSLFVEVVRCKDCVHRYEPVRCALWYATVGDKEYFSERGEDFYCKWGETQADLEKKPKELEADNE